VALEVDQPGSAGAGKEVGVEGGVGQREGDFIAEREPGSTGLL